MPKFKNTIELWKADEEKIVLSNSVTLSMHTVPVDQQAEIKDVKEPLTIPLDWKFILLIVFIVFIITDMLGATDIFPFVKPVN